MKLNPILLEALKAYVHSVVAHALRNAPPEAQTAAELALDAAFHAHNEPQSSQTSAPQTESSSG